MLAAAQDVEQTQRKTDVVAAQAFRIGRTIAGARRVIGRRLLSRILDPSAVAVVDQNLGILEPVVGAALCPSQPFALSAWVRATTSAPTGRRSAS